MATLEYIKNAKDKGLLLLGIAEEEESARYTVGESVYAAIGRPVRGEELSAEALGEIYYADESYRARKKALSLLAYTDNNKRTLRDKLVRAGIRREIAEEVTREMVGLGYINETRQLERLVEAEANVKLSGPLKIIPRLAAKGYSPSDIRRVIYDLADRGTVDFRLNAERLIEKKLSDDADAKEKQRLLYKYGYKK